MIPFSRYDDPLDLAESAAPGMTVLAETTAAFFDRQNFSADLKHLMTLPWSRMADELESYSAKEIRGFAEWLGLPTRYDEGPRKTAGVLGAAVYEHIRKLRVAAEV